MVSSNWILETERLGLRRLQPEDFDALFALYSDENVRRYFPEGTLTRTETQEELEWFLNGHPKHPELGLWATIEKESGRFIGRCGLLPWEIDGQFEVEIAYLIAPDYQKRGFATEAAKGIMQHAFTGLKRTRLVCLIDEDNAASIKVATNIGMHFEKAGKDDKGPFMLYSIERPNGMN